MSADELKKFCKDRGLAYRELATIHSAIKKGELSSAMSKSIELLIDNENLKEQLKEYELLKQVLKTALK